MTKKELIETVEKLPMTISFVANKSIFVTALDLSGAKQTLEKIGVSFVEETPCAIRISFEGNCE